MSRASDPRGDKTLPFRHVAAIDPKPKEALWLVESLWAASGVGVIAGLPKSMKTWFATELAVAVASGKDALGRFPVKLKGPALVYAAEDDLPAMRSRFQSVADARGVDLKYSPIYLIDLPALHLDDDLQLQRLHATVAELKPRLLVLDPFVRIVNDVDENSAKEVSSVLGSLRALQREHDVAIATVHHMRKSPSGNLGQQLRGSGDFAAWFDSAIYLVRQGPDLVLSAEHRGAPAPPPVRVRLDCEGPPHLVIEPSPTLSISTAQPDSLRKAILARLRPVGRSLSTVALRDLLKVRKATLLEVLGELRSEGLLARSDDGWALASAPSLQLALDE